MKKLGFLMITVGFLGGALAAVIDQEKVPWDYFSGGLAVGIVGVVLVRIGRRRASTAESKLAENIESIEMALSSIVGNITQLNDEEQTINTYDVRHKIDELFLEDLTSFVNARQTIVHLYGLSTYGDVMSCFAAGERYLNRVWSASADGYIDEVSTYIDKAREQFVDSLERIRQLKAASK